MTAAQLAAGVVVRGRYMGGAFEGVIVGVAADASGYRDMQNTAYVTIRVAADIETTLPTEEGGTQPWTCRRAGDTISMTLRSFRGGWVREDDRFEDVEIAGVAA